MAVTLVHVVRVDAHPVRGGFTKYDVVTPCAIYSTLDAWKATLCERAHQLDRPVTIGSRDTTYGQELVWVRLEESDAWAV